MSNSAENLLTQEIVATIDAEILHLESEFPGISKDPKVREEVDKAVVAALASLDSIVSEQTEAETKRHLESYMPTTLADSISREDPSVAPTKKMIEEMGRAAIEEEN